MALPTLWQLLPTLAAASAPSILSRLILFGCLLVSFPSTFSKSSRLLTQPPPRTVLCTFVLLLTVPFYSPLIVSSGPDYSIYRSRLPTPPSPVPPKLQAELQIHSSTNHLQSILKQHLSTAAAFSIEPCDVSLALPHPRLRS